MKLVFKTIHIENFLSFKSVDIDLSLPGYTSVIGINNNIQDSASSNGAGKTAIFEAINWGLCGETIRGTKDVKNCYTTDGALVELEFLADNTLYKIIRTKEHSKYKTNLKIFVNNEDKSGKGIRDSEKLLEQYLPDINSSLIGSVIILGQGLPQRFTNNTPSGRKEVLETLSKSDFMIKDLKDRIVIRKDVLSKKLREYEDKVLQLTTKKSLLETQLKDKESQLKNLETFDKDEKQNRLQELESLIKQYETDIDSINIEIEDYNNKLITITDSISNLSDVHIKNCSEINHKFDTSSLLREKTELATIISNLTSEIRTLENVKDTCPTCGQKLPNVHKIDTTEKHNQLDELKIKLENVDKEFSSITNNLAKALADETTRFNDSKSDLEKESINVKHCISDRKSVIDEERRFINLYSTEKSNIQYSLDTWKKSVDDCKDFISQHTIDINDIEEEILYNNSEKDNIKEHLDIVNKFYSIITRDFRGYLLSNIINFIDGRAKRYSEKLFDNDLLDFKLEGNNISIYHAGRPYENLSGGERQKVDIIVQFAIRDMLCKYLNFSSNILALDELTDNLDSKSCDKLFNLISSNLNDVESIYIISHHSDYSLPIDHELIVKKGEDGISYIE